MNCEISYLFSIPPSDIKYDFLGFFAGPPNTPLEVEPLAPRFDARKLDVFTEETGRVFLENPVRSFMLLTFHFRLRNVDRFAPFLQER